MMWKTNISKCWKTNIASDIKSIHLCNDLIALPMLEDAEETYTKNG